MHERVWATEANTQIWERMHAVKFQDTRGDLLQNSLISPQAVPVSELSYFNELLELVVFDF